VFRSVCLIAAAVLGAGCADARVFRGPPDPVRSAYAPDGLLGEPAYRVGCADVLAVTFADRPEWDCLAVIDLEGRLPLGPVGSPLVEGATTDEVRVKVARWAALEASRVDVRLADARAGRRGGYTCTARRTTSCG
jgi:hypothetical protein